MDTLQLKCPNCSASIGFNAGKQKFVCEFCGGEFTEREINEANGCAADIASPQDTPDIQVRPETQMQADTGFYEHTNVYTCQSCGAEIVADENTAATFCHYCHGAVTLKGRVSGDLQPELIIPFKIDRDEAVKKFKDWCGSKKFVPNDFRSNAQLEKMVGLYVPFWLADCDIDADASFDARIIRTHTSGNYQITNTKIFDVMRGATMEYRGIPADASKKLEDDLMDAVEPFDYRAFVPFSMNWFSGFYADRYDVDKNEAFARIKKRMEDGAEQVLRDSVKGYTTVTKRSRTVRIKKNTIRYAMLPVWFMTYIHGGKKYFFALNGQTGKLAGGLPVSKAKLAVLAGIIMLVSLIIGLIGGFMI